MNKKTLVWVSVVSCTVCACDNDPGAGKPTAEVSDALQNPSEAPNAPETVNEAVKNAVLTDRAASQLFVFDNQNSDLHFVGAKVTGKHEGDFKRFHGEIAVPSGDLARGAVQATVQMGSVEADEEKLTMHLKSSDFFDAEKYPEAKFVSTKVGVTPGDATGTHRITGNLSLHGVTKQISFPATITVSEARINVDSTFVLNRQDFGITYPGLPDDTIKDEVALTLKLQAEVPKSAQADRNANATDPSLSSPPPTIGQTGDREPGFAQ